MLAHHHAWSRVIGYQVLVWSVWIGFSLAIWALLRRVPLIPIRLVSAAFHLLVALEFAILHAAIWVAVELWLEPYDFMNPIQVWDRFKSVTLWQLPLEVLLYGLVGLAYHLQVSAARDRERERRASQLETSLAEARLHALKLQMQPHFLFNTLNSIGSLVRAGQPTEAVAMLGGLSELLRYSLDRSDTMEVPLAEEKAMVERYFDIQRRRFADRLEVEIDIPSEVLDAAVPVLLLQPLAENAIQHGIAMNSDPGRVSVRARRVGDELAVEITNPGTLPGTILHGIGLRATVSRLAEMYGDRGRFELHEEEGKVLAQVTLPWSTRP
ncbi:MAG TPA: histidine kinase, partial [Candidatus Eisenbacteria bacterium]|nr:histidine kinase [Candidatus Eisenbacteria bacterium]